MSDVQGNQWPATTATVTLADGREVSSSSLLWMEECLLRWQHVQNLRGRGLNQRREYLRALEHSSGAELANRVSADYLKDWEARKAAQAAPQPITTTESQP